MTQPELFSSAGFKGQYGEFHPPDDVCAGRHGGNQNSVAANAKIAPRKGALRQLVLDVIRGQGGHGATVDEVAAALGKTPNAVSGRVTELAANGLIFDMGRRRKTRSGCWATVWESNDRK